jgi:hypothetical protein
VDRVATTLETIKQTCVAATKLGTVLYATGGGTAAKGGTDFMPSYPATETFMQAIVPLGLMYIYAGQVKFGFEIMQRAFHNNVCRQGLTWYGENSYDSVTGKWRSGTDYAIRTILWGALAASKGSDLTVPHQAGGLVGRVLRAGR